MSKKNSFFFSSPLEMGSLGFFLEALKPATAATASYPRRMVTSELK
jgi:hypothetical protein